MFSSISSSCSCPVSGMEEAKDTFEIRYGMTWKRNEIKSNNNKTLNERKLIFDFNRSTVLPWVHLQLRNSRGDGDKKIDKMRF